MPGEIDHQRLHGRDLRLPGDDQTTFRKYGIDDARLDGRARTPSGTVKQGGALTTDGAGTIYALRGDGTQAFWAYDVATDTWTAKANTGHERRRREARSST